MKKKRLSRHFLIMAIFSVVTVFAWIGFDLYRIWNRPLPLKVSSKELLALSPKIDTKILSSLEKKKYYSREEFSASLGVNLTATHSSQPTATKSGETRKP